MSDDKFENRKPQQFSSNVIGNEILLGDISEIR